MKIYKVTEGDLIGELEGFPIPIVYKMLEYQLIQTGREDIIVFQRSRCAGSLNKGFTWNRTEEKSSFWFRVIQEYNFKLFFEKYPKNKLIIEEDV